MVYDFSVNLLKKHNEQDGYVKSWIPVTVRLETLYFPGD
jgi:hypothetical protein